MIKTETEVQSGLKYCLGFQVLISDILAKFLNMPEARLDSEINDAIRRITEFLGLEQGLLVQWWEDGTRPLIKHAWTVPGGLPETESAGTDVAPRVHRQAALGKIIMYSRVDDLPEDAEKDREFFRASGRKALISLPMKVGGGIVGALVFANLNSEIPWRDEVVRWLHLVTDVFAGVLERQKNWRKMEERLHQIEQLKERCENENLYLQEEVRQLAWPTEIVEQSASMKEILNQALQVAGTDTSVLIQGETGTGKELLAREIHNMSRRKDRPLVTVNCAALPPTLIENELFGREKGAFTGALTRMAGRFEVADGSTLFLDEIGELPLELQGKLLRVIEEGTFERLGSTKAVSVDVRMIAATNRDLSREVKEGRFRSDLFYRLCVFPITIPPLRERPEDIPLMVWMFVKEFQEKMGKRIDNIPKKSMDALCAYGWPGNGRELRNVIERAMIVSRGRTLEALLPENAEPGHSGEGELKLRDVERRHIIGVLERTSWRVTGKGSAAEALGLKGTTLQSKMKKLGIRRRASL